MPYAKINGYSLYYEDQGIGVPLLFIHPPLLTHVTFDRQAQRLTGEFRIIRPDIRGHGRSEYSDEPLTYANIVDDMVALLKELGVDCAYWVGYSTGGGVVLEAMQRHPRAVAGGILLSGMPAAEEWLLRTEITVAIKLSGGRLFHTLAVPICGKNADSLPYFWRLLQESRRGKRQNIHQYYEASLRYSCLACLPDIQGPVLLLYGLKDTQFHRYAQLLFERLPDRKLFLLKGAGHQLQIQAPSKLSELITRWVMEIEARQAPDAKAPRPTQAPAVQSYARPSAVAREDERTPLLNAETQDGRGISLLKSGTQDRRPQVSLLKPQPQDEVALPLPAPETHEQTAPH